MAVQKAHGSAKGAPVALPGDRLDCACIISDTDAGQQEPAAQTEALAVEQCVISSQDSEELQQDAFPTHLPQK